MMSRRTIAGRQKKVVPGGNVADVIPGPDFKIPATLFALGALAGVADNTAGALGCGLFGAFLTLQASRVKFVFGSDDLEVVIGEQEEKTDNAFVGGENKWR